MVLKRNTSIFSFLVTVLFFFSFTVTGLTANSSEGDTRDKIRNIDHLIKEKFKSYRRLLAKDNIPSKYQKLLYRRSKWTIKLLKENRGLTKRDKVLIESILSKADEFDLEDHDFDEISEEYTSLTNKIKAEQFNAKYFVSLSWITWNYKLSLTDSFNTKAALYAKEKGLCIGGGLSYSNSTWGGSLEGCYAYMTATVGEDSNTISYNQSNVAIDALVLKTGVFWKPKEDTSIGFYPLFVYHDGKYNPPAGGSIEDDNKFSWGYMISLQWDIEKFVIDLGFGGINSYKSSPWLLGLKYKF